MWLMMLTGESLTLSPVGVKSRLVIYSLFEKFRVILLPLLECLNGWDMPDRLLWHGMIIDMNVVVDSGLVFEC